MPDAKVIPGLTKLELGRRENQAVIKLPDRQSIGTGIRYCFFLLRSALVPCTKLLLQNSETPVKCYNTVVYTDNDIVTS